jgi:signal transduction histidine kinase
VVSDSFAAYVAHELRTPLATQRALLELALADSATDIATWRETGADVLHACRQQERLLEACLALARSRHGLGRCHPVNLAAVVATVLRAHEPGALTSIVRLEPAWTTGAPELVERLVANLVSNAIRHNVAGGRIEIATRTETARAVLSVTNTGRPVPSDAVGRLFEPFHAGSGGIGLGLAIVHAVAEAHEARLTARPRVGGGLAVEVGFTTLQMKGHPECAPTV